MRGTTSREGWHDYKIRIGGIEVFPTLVAAEHVGSFVGEPVSSGLAELDALLDGGPLRGTSTLLTGPAGSGKSTLSLQYVCAAAARGEHCVVYEFEERIGTMLVRGQAGAGSTGSHQDRAGDSPSGRSGSDRARRVCPHHPQGGRGERR